MPPLSGFALVSIYVGAYFSSLVSWDSEQVYFQIAMAVCAFVVSWFSTAVLNPPTHLIGWWMGLAILLH